MMKKVLLAGLLCLMVFTVFGCGGPSGKVSELEEKAAEIATKLEDDLDELEEQLESAQWSAQEIVRPSEVEGMTEELAAVVDHFIAEGINITNVESVMLSGAMGAEAGMYVSTDITFFELYQFDLDQADEQTLNYLDNLNEEYNSLNGNIVMAHPDRFDEYEEDYYTEAVEAIIEAFESF